MLALARAANVAVPLHASGLAIISVCYDQDFDVDNGFLPVIRYLNSTVLGESIQSIRYGD